MSWVLACSLAESGQGPDRKIRASCKEGKKNFNGVQHMLSKDRDQEQKLL